MKNPQTKKRILFVCNANRSRSLTAQEIYRGRPDLEVQSAGLSEYARVPLTRDLFEWADQVFVFSRRQQKALAERYGSSLGGKSVICLNLPDRFALDRPKLVTKLTRKLGRYLGEPTNGERASSSRSPAPAKAGTPIQLRLRPIAGLSAAGASGL